MEIVVFFDFMSQPASFVVQAHIQDLNIDHLKLIKGDYHGINFPVIFKQEYGKKLYDILNTGHAGFFLISDRFKVVLEEGHLTGWKVFPIKLYDQKGNEITGYHGFSVVGYSGATSYEKSEIIEKRRVSEGPICRFYKGIFVNNWDGSDFFTPDGTYETFITKKAADILKKNKISNIFLTRLADAEINIRHVKRNKDE